MSSNWGKVKFCSLKCIRHSDESKQKMRLTENKGRFSNGHKPWHKGKTGVYTKDTLKKMSKAKIGTLPGNYKHDDSIAYATLHKWIARKRVKPLNCEHCGEKRLLHWANKSHEYLRDVDDWLALCVPCHSKYDKDSQGSIKEKYGKS